jgi:hypothetical protein
LIPDTIDHSIMNSYAVTAFDVIFVAIMKCPDDLSLAPHRPAGVVVWPKHDAREARHVQSAL